MEPVRIEAWADIRELVLMSVGTDKGSWWADPAFGSELWILRQEGKITGKTAGTVRRMILDCLQWLKDDGLARSVSCFAELAGKTSIGYAITVEKPGEEPIFIKDVWDAV